jgi:triosephosphate isomerase
VRKVVVNIARFLLAAVFILSGFVKAVDPLGTQYKINDYLEAMHLGAMVPDFVTLSASVLQSAVEFVLGICLLFAIRRRLVTRFTLAIMIVMTLLTLWLALANPISDCGCFGDALVLSNWQTFWKNVALLAAAAIVSWKPLDMMRMIGRNNQWIVFNYSVLFILFIEGYCLYNLPMFYFRPYHVGANIKEGMTIPEGAQQPQFETTFILEKDGQQREFTAVNYPDSTWTFVDSRTVQTAEGYVPPIHDFSILTEEGDDITDTILSKAGYTFLLISPHLEQADDSQFGLINQLYEYCQENGYDFGCLTASTKRAISRWQDITGAEYPFYQADETTLKTVIRSNPGLLLLKQGTIIRKWSHNALPDEAQLSKKLEESELGKIPEDSVPGKIAKLLVWFVLPLMVQTIADRLWAWTQWVRRKKVNSE